MSVIESKYPILVISFNNCEIHACHLDGYKDDKEALINRLFQIEACFSKNSRCRIWYNVDDTLLSNEVVQLVAESILKLQDNIVKIAFIGVGREKRHFYNTLMNVLIAPNFPIEYFSDAELAKEWLR